MNMKKYILPVLIVILVPLVSFFQYLLGPYKVLEGFAQGTTYRIIYHPAYHPLRIFSQRLVDYSDEIDSLLRSIDNTFSLYDSNSVISRINNNDPQVEANDPMIEVFKKALEVTIMSDGAFDITVGPLVNAWGFGPIGKTHVDKFLIDSLMQFVGMDKLRLEGRKIIKALPGVKLDMNAIAQGYTVDRVGYLLENKRIKDYLVEIGGEVRTMGSKKKNAPWSIGIDRPAEGNSITDRQVQDILEVHCMSLATSGNYRKFYVEDGVKYSHTIDPKTGYPARNRLLSVTILASDCMTADALATACMVMGLEKSRLLINELEDVEAYFIYSDDDSVFRTEYTRGMEAYFQKEL